MSQPVGPRVPPSIRQMLGSAAPPVVIAIEGKEWRVGAPTLGALAAYEDLILGVRKSGCLVAEADPDVPERRKANQWEAYSQGRAANEHAYGGAWFREESLTPRGGLLWLLALLKEHHPDATLDDVKAIMRADRPEVLEAIERVMPAFFRLAALAVLGEGAAVLPMVDNLVADQMGKFKRPSPTPPAA